LIAAIVQNLFGSWKIGLVVSYFLYCLWHTYEAYPDLIYSPTSLNTFLVNSCPSLKSYTLSPFLWNGHFQTIGCSKIRRNLRHQFRRELFPFSDGGECALDWVEHPKPNGVVIVLHGLTGGSHENYVRHVVKTIYEANCTAVVFNYRGAGGSTLKTPLAYNGARTEDFRAVVNGLKKREPTMPLFGVGYSLGANILVKYLGEEGDKTPLVGAISVSNPFNFNKSSKQLNEHLFYKYTYSRALANNCKRFVGTHKDILKLNETVNVEEVLSKSVLLRDFDEFSTRRYFGYPSVDDYYRDASCSRFIPHVKIPLLCLSALDDPIVPKECIPFEECKKNKNIILVVTRGGGHVGWLRGWNPFRITKSWMDDISKEFINVVMEGMGNSSQGIFSM